MLRVAGSGHRPPKIFTSNPWSDENFKNLTAFIINTIENRQIDEVITGGALGFDQALATAAQYLEIPYSVYIPFEGFNSVWPAKSRNKLEALCNSAKEVRVISNHIGYAKAFQKRNEAMVDNSNYLLCLWDGTQHGGTSNCLEYAASKENYETFNLWDSWVKYRDVLDKWLNPS